MKSLIAVRVFAACAAAVAGAVVAPVLGSVVPLPSAGDAATMTHAFCNLEDYFTCKTTCGVILNAVSGGGSFSVPLPNGQTVSVTIPQNVSGKLVGGYISDATRHYQCVADFGHGGTSGTCVISGFTCAQYAIAVGSCTTDANGNSTGPQGYPITLPGGPYPGYARGCK